MYDVGKGWEQYSEQGELTGISVAWDEVFTELHPEFKNLRLTIKIIPQQQRGESDKAPSWRIGLYKPSKTGKTGNVQDDTTRTSQQQRYGETELTPEAPKRPPYGTQTQMQTQFANAAENPSLRGGGKYNGSDEAHTFTPEAISAGSFTPDDEEIPF